MQKHVNEILEFFFFCRSTNPLDGEKEPRDSLQRRYQPTGVFSFETNKNVPACITAAHAQSEERETIRNTFTADLSSLTVYFDAFIYVWFAISKWFPTLEVLAIVLHRGSIRGQQQPCKSGNNVSLVAVCRVLL